MGLSKNELIAKLEEISSLYQDTEAIKSEMRAVVPEDNYVREHPLPTFPGEYEDDETREYWEEAVDHEEEDAVESMMEFYDEHFCPKEPEKPVIHDCQKSVSIEADKTKQKLGCLPVVSIFIGVIALLTAITTGDADPLTSKLNWFIVVVCALCTGFFYLKLFKAKSSDDELLKEIQRQHAQAVEEKTEDYENAVKRYESECISYKLARQDFLDAYTTWREALFAHLQEEEAIKEKLKADRTTIVTKIYNEKYIPAVEKLNDCNDMVSEDYLPVLNVIIDLIKSSRADDLKEAINLYEEIAYRERQLQLKREQERQRQREEALRREDEERRHQEELEFRENQERQRRYEEERRRRDEERRHQEDMKQREQQERNRQYEERRRQEEDRRRQERAEADRKWEESRATERQCHTCSQVSHCSMAFRRPNCASYRPK